MVLRTGKRSLILNLIFLHFSSIKDQNLPVMTPKKEFNCPGKGKGIGLSKLDIKRINIANKCNAEDNALSYNL